MGSPEPTARPLEAGFGKTRWSGSAHTLREEGGPACLPSRDVMCPKMCPRFRAEARKPLCGKEAPVGIEPTNRGFADLCLTTWLRRRGPRKSLEHYAFSTHLDGALLPGDIEVSAGSGHNFVERLVTVRLPGFGVAHFVHVPVGVRKASRVILDPTKREHGRGTHSLRSVFAANRAWEREHGPADPSVFEETILPGLAYVPLRALVTATGLSKTVSTPI